MVAPVVAGSGNTKLDAFDDVSLVLSFNERQLCNLIDLYHINAKEWDLQHQILIKAILINGNGSCQAPDFLPAWC